MQEILPEPVATRSLLAVLVMSENVASVRVLEKLGRKIVHFQQVEGETVALYAADRPLLSNNQ